MRAPRDDRYVLYVLEVSGYYKVGITACFSRRLSQIQIANPLEVRCAHFRYVPAGRRIAIEREVHLALSSYRMHGEWFKADLGTIQAVIRDVLMRSKKTAAWTIYTGDCDAPAGVR